MGSAHFASPTEVPTHVVPEDAPSVIEGLMQSMIQYRRRMDQQTSQPSLGLSPTDMHGQRTPAPRTRRSLARHSDVSAVVSRHAAVRGDMGGGGAAPLSIGTGACFHFCCVC